MTHAANGAIAVVAGLYAAIGSAQAHDDTKYPTGGAVATHLLWPWDPTNRGGLAQKAPLSIQPRSASFETRATILAYFRGDPGGLAPSSSADNSPSTASKSLASRKLRYTDANRT